MRKKAKNKMLLPEDKAEDPKPRLLIRRVRRHKPQHDIKKK